MDLESVDSSAIEAIGFEDGDLHVNLHDGTSYTYQGVSPLVYANFLRVLSKGWFFNKYIRNSYPFTRG